MADDEPPDSICAGLRRCACRGTAQASGTEGNWVGARAEMQNHLHVLGLRQSEQTPTVHNHYNQAGSKQLDIVTLDKGDSNPES